MSCSCVVKFNIIISNWSLELIVMSINKFLNLTKNQHFVSQAEQRMNSCSANPDSNKVKIYRFNIEGVSPPRISPDGKVAICRNLSFHDLFTILRTPEKERINLEGLFGRYEGEFSMRATNLLGWVGKARSASGIISGKIELNGIEGCNLSEVLDDIKFIYKYKILVGIRNPFKIKDTLRDFAFALNRSLAEAGALELYTALEAKNKAEETRICSTYGVSPKEYREWIRLLILFLYVGEDKSAILDGFIDEFFKAKEFTTNILICAFDGEYALLPDTGVVKDEFSDGLATYMNVSKHCIVALKHTKIDGRFLDQICEENKHKLAGSVFGSLFVNDKKVLAGYNKICVKAAAKQVFSGAPEIAGVEVIEKSAGF